MIIKHRVFKVEKMSDFLAQKNSHEPSPQHFYTPKKIAKELNVPEDLPPNPLEFSYKKMTPISSSGHAQPKRFFDVSKSPSRDPLPSIHESPNIKKNVESRSKKSHFRIPSRSTPRLEPRINLSTIKLPAKKQLYNEMHIENPPPDDSRRKMIDRLQLKNFNEKYKLDFVPGYHNMNILTRCVELLNSENEPYVLENIVPNKYKEFVFEAERSHQGPTQRSHSEIGSNISSKKSTQESSFGSYLPDIRKSKVKDESSVKSLGKAWEASTGENKISTISSNFSLNSRLPLPKLDLETFKNALDYFKTPEQEGVFLYIKTFSKGVNGEFGFCEIVWNERRKNMACMTKFYIPRVYRKMKLVLPITLRLTEHIFKTLKLEKLSIKLLSGNTFAQNDLRILGFKLEKIDFEDGKKIKLFSIKRMEFEDLLNDLYYEEQFSN